MARSNSIQNYSDGVFKTANTVVHNLARANPDRVVIRQKRFGIWNEYSWADVDRLTKELAAALVELGVKQGSKVGILSENRRVLGMMPHPERASDEKHGGTDGKALFTSIAGPLAAA